jgi:hypothetical protein
MNDSCPVETQEFLVKAFAQANMIFSASQIKNNMPLCSSLKRFLFPPNSLCSLPLIGILERIHETCMQLVVPHQIRTEPVFHIFPVYQHLMDEGFMVPLKIVPSEDWQISDAFGTFGYDSEDTILEVFEAFLQCIEILWHNANSGKVLPLRWRKTFSLSLDMPLHFETLDGQSHQVPLAIAILRAFSETISSAQSSRMLPFGNQPVFSTGKLNLSTGFFDPVEKVEIKLAAFVREFGEGLPAVLTDEQWNSLNGNPIRNQVSLKRANNLTELMNLPELKPALNALCDPPLPTEIDHLLALMFQMCRSVRFKDMKYIIEWLRPNIHSPVYQFQLERNWGQTAAHRGQFTVAKERLDVAGELLKAQPKWFGISDIIDLTTAWCSMAVDSCDPDLAKPSLKQVEAHIDHASASDRVKFWGSRCQLYRMTGEYDLAVDAGYRSVEYADMALAGEAGVDRNYLVHALIARARFNPGTHVSDLAEAERLLAESRNEWAPFDHRESHLGFCLHYAAEISRLQEQPFEPPEFPPWSGDWGHPWMFVLLSCARNRQNQSVDRMNYAEKLIEFSSKQNRYPESLFELLDAVYDVYFHAMHQQPVDTGLERVWEWCLQMKQKGFPGWYKRLKPHVRSIRSNPDDMAHIEALCDAIHYH